MFLMHIAPFAIISMIGFGYEEIMFKASFFVIFLSAAVVVYFRGGACKCCGILSF